MLACSRPCPVTCRVDMFPRLALHRGRTCTCRRLRSAASVHVGDMRRLAVLRIRRERFEKRSHPYCAVRCGADICRLSEPRTVRAISILHTPLLHVPHATSLRAHAALMHSLHDFRVPPTSIGLSPPHRSPSRPAPSRRVGTVLEVILTWPSVQGLRATDDSDRNPARAAGCSNHDGSVGCPAGASPGVHI